MSATMINSQNNDYTDQKKDKHHVERTLVYGTGNCTLGLFIVAAAGQTVKALLFGENVADLEQSLLQNFPGAKPASREVGFEDMIVEITSFLNDPRQQFPCRLDVNGTAFQKRVWAALRDVPAGQTASYKEIATRIGSPKSMRAVAQACAANRIAVAIPCHRVIRSGGSLSGYRWGVERKRALLKQEGAV